MIESERLLAAYEKSRLDLLAERGPAGHWTGELSTSALSTATAVSALALIERHLPGDPTSGRERDEARGAKLRGLIMGGLDWLGDHQNADGGWGDTDLSHSNIATTMLVVAAFHLTCVPTEHAGMLARAQKYIESKGGVRGLRKRYGRDKTFAVPILTNCALAGLVPWSEVSPLPFEAACVPQKFYRLLQLPVVSYAIPALVAIGQARYFHKKPWNPLMRLVRAYAVAPSLRVLERMQPASGGFLEAVPLTSFVVMSLASTGRAEHPVAQLGAEFIENSVRPDGSWPIDTNLATWNTTLAINALAAGGDEPAETASLDWLLGCQHREQHPFTGAEPGGFGWSDLSGAVPDADDTPGALLALAAWRESASCGATDQARIQDAAQAALQWLLGLQNRDGGWPTFCRGWGKLPFDRSGADLTAHVLRAIEAWRDHIRPAVLSISDPSAATQSELSLRMESAAARGWAYLNRQQQTDGSWIPLWFGNQDHPREENPIYGTAKVLLAYRDSNRLDTAEARRGFDWLKRAQNADGGWGSCSPPAARSPLAPREEALALAERERYITSSVEETAIAVEALLAAADATSRSAVEIGLEWLVRAVEENRHQKCSPIGFYFAKLWYYEKLYPLTFAVSALGRAQTQALSRTEPRPASARLTNA